MIKICIIGAAGRMGRNIATSIYNDNDCEVTGAVDRKGGEFVNQYVYELAGCGKEGALITDNILEAASNSDVLIDFTGAAPTVSNLPLYKEVGKPVVIGSTGLSSEEKLKIEDLSKVLPVVFAPNMSLGVNVALKLIEEAAKALKGYDIELSEIHHKMKKDAPSGTAMAMAQAAAKGANLDLEKEAIYSRHGMIGERRENEIGIQTLRGGDVAGDHTVYFFGNGERLEITHMAHSRQTFANGAVKAAKWVINQPVGLYNMQDVLGLK